MAKIRTAFDSRLDCTQNHMKNALFLGLLILGVSVTTAQVKASEKTAKIESVSFETKSNGDSVEITYRHANGMIAQQGYLKDKKPVGVWKQFDTDGHVIAKGTYVEGKREGTWFFLTNEGIRIANYSNNQLVGHAISKDGYALLND